MQLESAPIGAPQRATKAGLAAASIHVGTFVALAYAGLVAVLSVRAGLFGFDFAGTTWQAGRDVLAGHSPFPAADPRLLVAAGHPAVYPPPLVLVALPLALLPLHLAAAVWAALNAGGFLLALWLVGVRSRWIFALVAVSLPFLSLIVMGRPEGLLALACAAAWRYRDRVVAAGAVVAVGIAAKLILWPLVVWLVATRRWRQAAIASGGALALLLVGWAAIGFRGLADYPRLLAADATAFQNRGHSLVAVGIRLGLGVDGARTLAALVALALLASTVYLARRADGDRRAYAAAIGAAVFCSPIVWANYFLLPLVPLAIARPRLSAVWLVPLALWISPSEPAGTGPLLVAVAVVLAIVGLGMERGADARRGLGHEAAR